MRLNSEPSSELGTGDALGSTQHPCSGQLRPALRESFEGSQFEFRDAGSGLQEARRRGQQPDMPKDLMEAAKVLCACAPCNPCLPAGRGLQTAGCKD